MSDISSGDLHRHTIVSERKSQDGCRAALLMPKSTRTDKEVHTFQKSQGRKSRCTTVLPRYDHDDADAEDNKKHQNPPPSEKANIATPRRKPAATRELWKGPTTHRLAVQGGGGAQSGASRCCCCQRQAVPNIHQELDRFQRKGVDVVVRFQQKKTAQTAVPALLHPRPLLLLSSADDKKTPATRPDIEPSAGGRRGK